MCVSDIQCKKTTLVFWCFMRCEKLRRTMRQNALPVLCRKRRETSGISSQVSRSPAWTTEEEEAARSIMVFGLSLVKLVVGFGPPKKGSFLEGKWDPENFRQIWVGKYYFIWPDGLGLGRWVHCAFGTIWGRNILGLSWSDPLRTVR